MSLGEIAPRLPAVNQSSARFFALTGLLSTAEFYGASPNASPAANVAAINNALSMGGVVTINTPGTYRIGKSTTVTRSSGNTYDLCLVIPSNTTFRLGVGVVLQAAAGLNNPALIQNSNTSGGNVGITLEGPGFFDGNSANVTDSNVSGNDLCAITIWLQNINGLTLNNFCLTNPRRWGIGIAACNNVRTNNTLFSYTAAVNGNQGGYQFQGQNSNVIVRNTTGNTYDDLCAFVTQDTGNTDINSMAGPGPVNDVLVDGLFADPVAGVAEHIRLLDSLTYPIQRVIIRNVSGPYGRVGAVTILNAGGVTPLERSILVDGVNCDPLVGGPDPSRATISIAGSADSVTICNVNRVYADGAETTHRPVIDILSGGTVAHLTIQNLSVLDTTTGGAGIGFVQVETGTILSALLISNYRAQVTKSTGSDSLVSIIGTLGRLEVSGVETIRVANLLKVTGTVSQGAWFANVFSSLNQAAAFTQSAASTLPILGLDNVCLNGTQGAALGCINVNGVTGTMFIQMSNCNFANGANVNLVRAGSEAIRVQSMSTPVPSGILTQAVGDIFLDSSNSNNPYRCSTAPTTFTAL